MRTILVFVLYIVFHDVSTFFHFTPALSIVTLLVAALVPFVFARWFKATYFYWGLTAMLVIMAAVVGVGGNEVVIRYTTSFMYGGLLLASLVPPLLNYNPFTYEYSAKNYPDTIIQSKTFKTVNLIINHMWSVLFILAAILSSITYSAHFAEQEFWSSIIPISPQLLIGLPLTLYLPTFLQKKLPAERMVFSSCIDMFQMMPYGINEKEAKNLDVVFQFKLSGSEPVSGYLTIKNGKCSFSEGVHADPTMTIHSPSQVWLDISNGKMEGSEAFLNRLFSLEGDASFLLKLNKLFPSSPSKPDKKIRSTSDPSVFSFGHLTARSVKKALIIDGGMRSAGYSKTELLARRFEKGLVDSGVHVDYIKLKSYKINDCLGCYSCWTKTPGVCVHKDDMPELLLKYREADLLVFASPLFVFSVTAVLKRFLDRLIPTLEGRILDDNGVAHHPLRYPSDPHKGVVVISAAGFPQIQNNYEGFLSLFRNFSRHGDNLTLLGELILPGAELMSVPVFSDHRKKVQEACYQAGQAVVKSGLISQQLMDIVQSLPVERDQFIKEASMFWESFRDGRSYYEKVDAFSQDEEKGA